MAMASLMWLLCMFLFMNTAAYELADPNVTKTHCLDSKQPLLFEDPYPTSVQDDNFIEMIWFYRPFDKGGVKQEKKELLKSHITKWEPVVKDPRFKKYQHWGLSLENPKLEDAGIYEALLSVLTNTLFIYQTTNVIMAVAPTLKTDRLAVSRSLNKQTGEITLNCGTVASLGTPPVQLIWRAPNGTAIDAVYKDGNITLNVGSDEGAGTYTCEVAEQSLAFECVPPAKVPLWEGKFNFDRETMHFSESNIMMIVIIVCVVVAIIIALIVIVAILKRKRTKSDYNGKGEETKAGNEQGGEGEQSYPLMIQDDSNPYDKPNSNKYTNIPKSPADNSAGLYMVSGLNFAPEGKAQEPMELPPKRRNMSDTPVNSNKNAVGDKGNGKPVGRYAKRGETKDTVASLDGKEPPTPKKRSIFLTESNEALDKIAEAVAGGKGSGAERDRARVGESSV